MEDSHSTYGLKSINRNQCYDTIAGHYDDLISHPPHRCYATDPKTPHKPSGIIHTDVKT